MSTSKVVIFDIDNTLTIDNSWERINKAAGMTDAEDFALYESFHKGRLSYQDWTEEISRIYRERAMITPEIAHQALCNYTLRTGTKLVITELQKRGYRIVLVTGGFTITAAHIAQTLGITNFFAVNDLLFTSDGTFSHIESKGEEGASKLTLAINDAQTLGQHDLKNYWSVGDSTNDIPLFDAAGHSITFSWCTTKVQDHAEYIVDNLSDILELLA